MVKFYKGSDVLTPGEIYQLRATMAATILSGLNIGTYHVHTAEKALDLTDAILKVMDTPQYRGEYLIQYRCTVHGDIEGNTSCPECGNSVNVREKRIFE